MGKGYSTMAKTKNTNTETVARRGRPANFPGQETTKRLYNLPTETIEMIENEAARREQPIGVVVDALVRRGFKEANRGRKNRS